MLTSDFIKRCRRDTRDVKLPVFQILVNLLYWTASGRYSHFDKEMIDK